ncbi:MAG TPA: NAD(P)/FAD-dependent oxidoreductase [Terriglobales bacterium]|jgi:monoamine oxidase
MQSRTDVIIVGAGIAGLSAALDLVRGGKTVVLLEARDRIGGRIETREDMATGAAIELGAEFIHGLAPEIWEPLQAKKILVSEVQGESWCVSRENNLGPCDLFGQVDDILGKLTDEGPDESFLQFLDRQTVSPQAKQWARSYVTGFHAADPGRISVHSLAFGLRAEHQIEGDRAFRMQGGYRTLVEIFRAALAEAGVSVHLNAPVESIQWEPGHAKVSTRAENGTHSFESACVLVTLPLGVLQAEASDVGAVHFEPALPEIKKRALAQLAMGKAVRVTLRFDERFWEKIRPQSKSKTLANMSFLFSSEDWFPTWWTTMPLKLPILTAWAPASCAERLTAQTESFVINKALGALSNNLQVDQHELERRVQAAYWHDWESDPLSRGAYSYVTLGGDTAQRDLGLPVADTLFFAGEATDVTGHNGTVHGAIAGGRRAAREILGL